MNVCTYNFFDDSFMWNMMLDFDSIMPGDESLKDIAKEHMVARVAALLGFIVYWIEFNPINLLQ